MKKFLIYVIVAVIFLAVIGTISFAIINSNDNTEMKIYQKVLSEIKYLDNNILLIINGLNNLQIGPNINVEKSEKESQNTESVGDSSSSTSEESEQSGNGKEIKYSVNSVPVLLINKENIDWEGLLKEAEQMYSSWSTIVIDLNSINARNEDILSFGLNLDNLIINLKQQNKLESAISLANMYSLLPEYINKIEGNSQNYYMTKIKAGVLKAYATIEDERWDIVSEGLTESNNNMDSLLNSELMLNNSKQNTIEEIYVLLKELTKTANQKEKDLFILKYVNLMETIEKI